MDSIDDSYDWRIWIPSSVTASDTRGSPVDLGVSFGGVHRFRWCASFLHNNDPRGQVLSSSKKTYSTNKLVGFFPTNRDSGFAVHCLATMEDNGVVPHASPRSEEPDQKRRKIILSPPETPPSIQTKTSGAQFPSTVFIEINNTFFRKKSAHFDNASSLLGERRPLTTKECELWSSSLGAKYAALHHSPAQTCRRLGTITRVLHSTKILKFKKPSKATAKANLAKRQTTTAKAPTLTQTKTQVRLKHQNSPKQLDVAAKQLQLDWKDVLQSGPMIPGWHGTTGEVQWKSQDKNVVSCQDLLLFLKSDQLQDEPQHKNQVSTLYNGLSRIPMDTVSILQALLDLMDPSALYKLPLVAAYPVLEHQEVEEDGTSPTTYRLTIAVYAHRLLYECMTQKLQIVMAALDSDSTQIAQPLVAAPSVVTPNDDPVFDSDPWPQVVVMDDAHYQAKQVANASKIGNQRKKQATTSLGLLVQQKKPPVQEDSTRSEDYLDAFSTTGFLKLIENHGTKVEGDWPALLAKTQLNGGLQVELMLHQIHGVCWMNQMEQLPGMGLNSLIWEERQFPEGDVYYYSPALGQARLHLDCTKQQQQGNAAATGGMLVDEMGTVIFCFVLFSSSTTFRPLTYVLSVSTSRTWKDCPSISASFGYLDGTSATSRHNNAQPIPSCNANHRTSRVGQPVDFRSPKDCRGCSGS
jgi:hypothetical protein